MEKRRDFIRKIAAGSAGIIVAGNAFSLNAKNYRRVIGANDKLRVAIIGVNGRGNGMGKNFAQQKNTEVASICDVDERALGKAVKAIEALNIGYIPKSGKDLRKVMEDSSIDAVYTATPDHWHAPITIMGCKAGKHVYVEKPLCHNPREGEMAVEAATEI